MTLKFGLLGAGRIGKVHAGAVAATAGAELVAVADAIPEAAAFIGKNFGAEVRSIDAIMNAKDIDAVLITTPTDMHADMIEQAGARLDAARLTRRLASALRGLPASDRDTLLLYAWGDLDYAGIARALDVPIGTVRSRLNRARRILRTAAGTNDPELEKEHGRVDAAAQHA